MFLGWTMFRVRKSRVRQDFELGSVFSKEAKSWACFWVRQCSQYGIQELGRIFKLGKVFSEEIKSWAFFFCSAMLSVRKSRVRHDSELGRVFSKGAKSWACAWVRQCFQ